MVDFTALPSRSGRPIATFLNSYVSHGSTARFLRGKEKYYVILQVIHCCFQQWKNFQNQLTVDEIIAKSLTPHFLNAVYNMINCNMIHTVGNYLLPTYYMIYAQSVTATEVLISK